ncbi:uncharacterized protein K452DRAFT_286304 [Aplosporella prunicola CBS 121167]|uniref:Uncharacterized protein n=1 Tax=Aplosporella prunicola CBS 121167 TaxID=1176127 RepID=A0A6A6BLP8_9PEZI|nr:uncharacterized protein K452DRAFT_286304 [Aplosporella prunicola CBS 121167]KAF2143471.1 hypothetical protein K452DRAFT_286304 [Aplosporella prunicola CBS 121167]
MTKKSNFSSRLPAGKEPRLCSPAGIRDSPAPSDSPSLHPCRRAAPETRASPFLGTSHINPSATLERCSMFIQWKGKGKTP